MHMAAVWLLKQHTIYGRAAGRLFANLFDHGFGETAEAPDARGRAFTFFSLHLQMRTYNMCIYIVM